MAHLQHVGSSFAAFQKGLSCTEQHCPSILAPFCLKCCLPNDVPSHACYDLKGPIGLSRKEGECGLDSSPTFCFAHCCHWALWGFLESTERQPGLNSSLHFTFLAQLPSWRIGAWEFPTFLGGPQALTQIWLWVLKCAQNQFKDCPHGFGHHP